MKEKLSYSVPRKPRKASLRSSPNNSFVTTDVNSTLTPGLDNEHTKFSSKSSTQVEKLPTINPKSSFYSAKRRFEEFKAHKNSIGTHRSHNRYPTHPPGSLIYKPEVSRYSVFMDTVPYFL